MPDGVVEWEARLLCILIAPVEHSRTFDGTFNGTFGETFDRTFDGTFDGTSMKRSIKHSVRHWMEHSMEHSFDGTFIRSDIRRNISLHPAVTWTNEPSTFRTSERLKTMCAVGVQGNRVGLVTSQW